MYKGSHRLFVGSVTVCSLGRREPDFVVAAHQAERGVVSSTAPHMRFVSQANPTPALSLVQGPSSQLRELGEREREVGTHDT
jgi:hypothetical protein